MYYFAVATVVFDFLVRFNEPSFNFPREEEEELAGAVAVAPVAYVSECPLLATR